MDVSTTAGTIKGDQFLLSYQQYNLLKYSLSSKNLKKISEQMSPTPQMYGGWMSQPQQGQSKGWNSCSNNSSTNGLNSLNNQQNQQKTFQMNATNFNNNNNQLPKFQDTFDSGNTWSANSSRRGSLENNTGSIFGNSSRKVDIAAEVDNVVYEDVKNWVNSSMKSL